MCVINVLSTKGGGEESKSARKSLQIRRLCRFSKCTIFFIIKKIILFFFPVCIAIISFAYLRKFAGNSNITLNNNSDSKHTDLISDFSWNIFSVLSFKRSFASGFWKAALCLSSFFISLFYSEFLLKLLNFILFKNYWYNNFLSVMNVIIFCW